MEFYPQNGMIFVYESATSKKLYQTIVPENSYVKIWVRIYHDNWTVDLSIWGDTHHYTPNT